MIVSFVVVADEKNGIGKDNQLLCHLPADLKFFKQVTHGHHIAMGIKTYQSIGKPLPGRTNIVISRHPHPELTGCVVKSSVEEAISFAMSNGETELMIVGGGIIYKLAFHLTNRIYLTRIHHVFDADTFFQAMDPSEWKIVSQEDHQADDKNAFNYSFLTYERLINADSMIN